LFRLLSLYLWRRIYLVTSIMAASTGLFGIVGLLVAVESGISESYYPQDSIYENRGQVYVDNGVDLSRRDVPFEFSHAGCYYDPSGEGLRYGPHEYGYSIASCRQYARDNGMDYYALRDGGECSTMNDEDYDDLGERAPRGSGACPSSGLGSANAIDLYNTGSSTTTSPMDVHPMRGMWEITLTVKDIGILVLMAMNMVMIAIMVITCKRQSGRRTKYQVVSVGSDIEPINV